MSIQDNKKLINLVQHRLINISNGVTMMWDPSLQFHGLVHTATLAVCTVLVIFVLILGTFGNGMVLRSALQCRKMRSNFDILIFNLAGADFIMCLLLSPTFLFLLFLDPPSPREFCAGYLFASTTCGLLSLLTLVAIAAHRQSWLKGRTKSSVSTFRTVCIIIAIYVLGLCTAIAGAHHVTTSWVNTDSNCHNVMNDMRHNNIVLYFIVPVVIISFIIITVSYSSLAKAVRVQTYLRVKALQPLLRPVFCRPLSSADKSPSAQDLQQSPMFNSVTAGPLRQCSCCSCLAALDQENKAVTMCVVLIFIIGLCWTPLVISHFIEVITGESIIIFQVKLCGIALIFLNSALNPYMYAQSTSRINQSYGRYFWEVIQCGCRIPLRRRCVSFITRTADVKPLDNPANITD